jgi:hypothetical protein
MFALFHVGRARHRASQPQEIVPGVYCMETGKGIMRSNVYFVRSGSSWALIDTASANCGRVIQKAADRGRCRLDRSVEFLVGFLAMGFSAKQAETLRPAVVHDLGLASGKGVRRPSRKARAACAGIWPRTSHERHRNRT